MAFKANYYPNVPVPLSEWKWKSSLVNIHACAFHRGAATTKNPDSKMKSLSFRYINNFLGCLTCLLTTCLTVFLIFTQALESNSINHKFSDITSKR